MACVWNQCMCLYAVALVVSEMFSLPSSEELATKGFTFKFSDSKYAGLSSPLVWRVSFMCDMTDLCVTWLIHVWHASFMCDVTHLQIFRPQVLRSDLVWRASFMCDMTYSCVTWLIHVWHDSFMCDMTHVHVTWLIHMWHDSFMCDMTCSWQIHVPGVMYSHVGHDLLRVKAPSFNFQDMIRSWVMSRDLFVHVGWLFHESHVQVLSYIHMTWLSTVHDITVSYVRRDEFMCVTWLI